MPTIRKAAGSNPARSTIPIPDSQISVRLDNQISNRYYPRPRFEALKPLRGKIIALEGIDQSGKRTQTRLLADELKKKGAKVITISFPIYKSPSGRQIQRFLQGKQEYPATALHMLYSLNRWENQEQIVRLTQDSDFAIADRYYPSNLAYGVSRGLSLDWLEGLDRGLPTASLVIVLDVPVPASFARKSRGRDVHEKNRQLLVKVRRTYQTLAKKLGWKVVDATRPVEEVHEAVWSIVRKKFWSTA
jgi:dTMP kinase